MSDASWYSPYKNKNKVKRSNNTLTYKLFSPRPIIYSHAALVRKIVFLPLENRIYMLAPPCNNLTYYTTQAVRGPITKINQSKCSIAGPIFSKYRTGHCPEWSRTCVFAFFSRVINLLLTKLARDRTGRISALGLFCTYLAALGPYCQDLWPIFSKYGPRAWLIRYIHCPFKNCLIWLRTIQKSWFAFYTWQWFTQRNVHDIACNVRDVKVQAPLQNCECQFKWNQPCWVTQPLSCMYLEQFIQSPLQLHRNFSLILMRSILWLFFM